MPSTRHSVKKESVVSIHLTFDTLLTFKSPQIQRKFTNIFAPKNFKCKDILQIFKTFFSSYLVQNNAFLVRLDENLKQLLKTDRDFLYKSQYLPLIQNVVRLAESQLSCHFVFSKELEKFASVGTLPVKKIIEAPSTVPICLSAVLDTFVKETLQSTQTIWTLSDIQSRMFDYINRHKGLLTSDKDSEILLLDRLPQLQSVYNMDIIHCEQIPLWLFHISYYTSTFEIEVIEH